MGKSEGEVIKRTCPYCGSHETDRSSVYMDGYVRCAPKTRPDQKVGCGRTYYPDPIHPARLAAEGLVPDAALEELVKATGDCIGDILHGSNCSALRMFEYPRLACDCRLGHLKSALAHAREIAKGGK